MKEEVAKLWTAALRSGKYVQGQGCLRQSINDVDHYCCLGVLCKLGINNGLCINEEESSGNREVVSFDGEVSYLPYEVREWSGMKSRYGSFDTHKQNLANLNDDGKTFNEIADIIDSHFEEL